jgi:hypothetical protein
LLVLATLLTEFRGIGRAALAALLEDSGRPAWLAAGLVRLSLTRNPSLDKAATES